jgi:hypothetical protein
LGHLESALENFQKAYSLGRQLSQLNIGHILEQLGHIEDSRLVFNNVLQYALENHLPTYYIKIRQSTLLPKILPLSKELLQLRQFQTERMQYLISNSSEIEIDNTSPLTMVGYSMGTSYLYHNLGSNALLKNFLYRLYLSLCPALSQGYFIGSESKSENMIIPTTSSNSDLPSVALEGCALTHIDATDDINAKSPLSKQRIKVAFVSRFFFHHFIGIISAGIIELLATNDIAIPDEPVIELHIVFVDGGEGTIYHDHLQNRLINLLPEENIHFLNSKALDLGGISRYIRRLDLDVIIYPEIGLDPVTYFLSFARLAAVQAAWIGHPDTTGIETIDYFLSSDEEQSLSSMRDAPSLSNQSQSGSLAIAQQNYVEKLYTFTNFGTLFIDYYKTRANIQFHSPRTILLNRMKFLESVNLPKLSHLYIIPFSPVKIHPDFDIVIRKILQQDKLSFIMIYELGQSRLSWQTALASRIVGDLDESLKERILFPTPINPLDSIGIIQLAHVILDPFPASGAFDTILQSLAIGIPVVTMPSRHHISGRFALKLYKMLGYGISSTLPDDEEDEGVMSQDKHNNNRPSLDPIDRTNGSSQQHKISDSASEEIVIIDSELVLEANKPNKKPHRKRAKRSSKNDLTRPSAHESLIGDLMQSIDHVLQSKSNDEENLYSPLVVNSVNDYIETAMRIAHQPKIREFHTKELLKRREKLFHGDVSKIVTEWKRFFKTSLELAKQNCKN